MPSYWDLLSNFGLYFFFSVNSLHWLLFFNNKNFFNFLWFCVALYHYRFCSKCISTATGVLKVTLIMVSSYQFIIMIAHNVLVRLLVQSWFLVMDCFYVPDSYYTIWAWLFLPQYIYLGMAFQLQLSWVMTYIWIVLQLCSFTSKWWWGIWAFWLLRHEENRWG